MVPPGEFRRTTLSPETRPIASIDIAQQYGRKINHGFGA